MKVTVCINTYKRPSVYDTLKSIAAQQLVPSVSLAIVISDNDAEGSGLSAVNRARDDFHLDIDYEIVPEKNIAIARNHAVSRADGDWILFIDDDERAHPGWVTSMLECADEYDADLVLGRVVAHYADETPEWVAEADPLTKNWGKRGQSIPMASTCNLLVRARLLKCSHGPFDSAYGRMGCDDAQLTHRLFREGAKIVINDQCPVEESVPVDRGSVDYLEKRYRRLGQSHALVAMPHMSLLRRTSFATFSILKMLMFFVLSASMRNISKSRWLRFYLMNRRNVGKFDYIFSRSIIEMY